jgi:serine/threonine-protein phosphatase PGAM5
MSKRLFYFIRNAEYTRNEGSAEGNLTYTGEEQAQHTAEALSHLSINNVYCSPYAQVRQTTHIIALHLGLLVRETRLLRQYDTFQMEDGTLNRKQFLGVVHHQQKQLDEMYTMLVQPPTDEHDTIDVAICHANIIRDLICKALDIQPFSWANRGISHCGISIISIDSESKVELLAYNDVKHLPIGLVSE